VVVVGGGAVKVVSDGEAYAERVWGRCMGTRRSLTEQLVARGADPERRARERRIAIEAQLRIDAELAAARADDDARAAAGAEAIAGARAALVARLTGRGAMVRTPMPSDVDEQPGEPPMPGYAWAGGHWEWRRGQWQWIPGYWLGATGGTSATTVVTGGAPLGAVVTGGVTISVDVGVGQRPPSHTQDHR
jgi:hypothetical protein